MNTNIEKILDSVKVTNLKYDVSLNKNEMLSLNLIESYFTNIITEFGDMITNNKFDDEKIKNLLYTVERLMSISVTQACILLEGEEYKWIKEYAEEIIDYVIDALNREFL